MKFEILTLLCMDVSYEEPLMRYTTDSKFSLRKIEYDLVKETWQFLINNHLLVDWYEFLSGCGKMYVCENKFRFFRDGLKLVNDVWQYLRVRV